MTNPFLKAEVETTIKDIQDNIEALETCLKSTTPRSPLLAAFYPHQKDVGRILKNGP
jgi:hypothetical protein